VGVGGQRHAPRKDPVPIAYEVGWAPGPLWTAAENLAPIGFRSLDRPAPSQPLYRLRYPGPRLCLKAGAVNLGRRIIG
jgi:hypothetical protein